MLAVAWVLTSFHQMISPIFGVLYRSLIFLLRLSIFLHNTVLITKLIEFFTLLSVSYFFVATFSGLVFIPSLFIISPKNFTFDLSNLHLAGLILSPNFGISFITSPDTSSYFLIIRWISINRLELLQYYSYPCLLILCVLILERYL